MNHSLSRLLSVTAIGLAVATPALADRVGDSYRELSAQWWQWAISIPVPSNPLFDPTDPASTVAVNCMVGQRGSVWFLGGVTSSGVTRRSCSVPEGVTLFFPVINSINFDTPGVCGQVGTLTVPELRSFSAAFIDAASGLEAKLDNRRITHVRRVRSEVFAVATPTDSLFLAPCLPAGIFSPAVDDGYYVKLEGLAPGIHTLEFKGKSGVFELDVAYVLNVTPVSREVKR